MSAAERVARGAAMLDEKRPGWAAEIDLSVLELAYPCHCVLGQLYRPADTARGEQVPTGAPTGFHLGTLSLALTQPELVFCGFDIEAADSPKLYDELDELWIAEIRRRTAVPA